MGLVTVELHVVVITIPATFQATSASACGTCYSRFTAFEQQFAPMSESLAGARRGFSVCRSTTNPNQLSKKTRQWRPVGPNPQGLEEKIYLGKRRLIETVGPSLPEPPKWPPAATCSPGGRTDTAFSPNATDTRTLQVPHPDSQILALFFGAAQTPFWIDVELSKDGTTSVHHGLRWRALGEWAKLDAAHATDVLATEATEEGA